MSVFDESKHARGTGAKGGQFVAKGSSGDNDTIGFDSGRGTGAGYGKAGGDARVKQLQKALNALGFTDAQGRPLAVDGKLGPKTTAAIKRLQRRLGVKADGLVTPELLGRLQRAQRRKKAVPAKKATTPVPAKKAAPPAKRVPPKKTPARPRY